MSYKTSLRTLRPGDPDFCVQDGMMVATRAGLEISNTCPSRHKQILSEAIINSWITPIAVVKDSELFWQEFSK